MSRVVFAGTGLIAWAHGLGIKSMIDAGLVDAQLVAAYDPDPDHLQGFSSIIGCAPHASLPEAIAAGDVVWICSPTAPHKAIVAEAIAQNRAMFCEKPLAENLPAAAALTAAVEASGLAAQAGLVLRSAPVFRKLRDLIAGEAFGPVMTVLLRDDQYFPTQGRYASSWRSDQSVAGGGCLIEHSIHDVDILRFCFGEPESVSARSANHAGHRGIEDVVSLTMPMASGAIVNLTSVWHGVLSRGSSRRLEVFTERAFLWLENDFRGPIHIETSDGEQIVDCPSPSWVDDLDLPDDEIGLAIRAYVEADRTFLDALSKEAIPDPALSEALVAHEWVDAAYRSAAAGGEPMTVAHLPAH